MPQKQAAAQKTAPPLPEAQDISAFQATIGTQMETISFGICLPGKEDVNVSLAHSSAVRSVRSLNSASYFFRILNHLLTSLTNRVLAFQFFLKRTSFPRLSFIQNWFSSLLLLLASKYNSDFQSVTSVTSTKTQGSKMGQGMQNQKVKL